MARRESSQMRTLHRDNFHSDSSFARSRRFTASFHRVVTMFLGGSYHDRDNPHRNQASHGKSIVWKTSECSQKEGRQQRSDRRRSGDDDDDDDDDEEDAKDFLRRTWYKMYSKTKIVTRQRENRPLIDDLGEEDNKDDDNDMNNDEPMYDHYGHDKDKRRHRYDAALVAAPTGGRDRTRMTDADEARQRQRAGEGRTTTRMKMMKTRPDRMEEDHAGTLFEFVGWVLCPSAHEHASKLRIQRHDDGRRRRELTYKTDLM
jgi:hypothetical protein